MTISAQLQPVIRARGRRLVDVAGATMVTQLKVPRRTGELQRSRRTRPVGTPTLPGYEIAFPVKQAKITDVGPKAHVIRGRPILRFYWPKVGRVVYFRSVRWKPGPGVARNRGWWSKTITERNWAQALRAASRL